MVFFVCHSFKKTKKMTVIVMIMMTVMVIVTLVVTMIIIMVMKHWYNDKQQKGTYLTPNLPAQSQYGRSRLENVSVRSVIQNI